MPATNRDRDIVEHILRYCNQVETAHLDFGRSKDRFVESSTYQNAVSMCILQIGELAGKLSEEARAAARGKKTPAQVRGSFETDDFFGAALDRSLAGLGGK